MSYTRATELVTALTAAGIYATADPKEIDTPCVLVTPAQRQYNLNCGYTANWTLIVLVAPPGNAEAWQQLDDITSEIENVVNIESVTPSAYDTNPSYEIRFTELLG